MKEVFDRIDEALEQKYGHLFSLHPARAKHKTTANPEDDGLFNLGAAFSAGYGSKSGRGYTIEIRVATLKHVPADFLRKIEKEVENQLALELPNAFPGRKLHVARDGHILKIVGDLSLGAV